MLLLKWLQGETGSFEISQGETGVLSQSQGEAGVATYCK